MAHGTGEYCYGTPSFPEWSGLWKASPEVSKEVPDEEFDEAYSTLEQALSEIGKVGFTLGCDFYVLGDSYGDRTHDVQLVHARALTINLLNQIQGWIRAGHSNWRVLIPVCKLGPTHTLVVYENVVRLPPEFEADLERGLEEIRRRLMGQG